MKTSSQIDTNFWRDKDVLLTGHSGFKGSWLSAWLKSLGAKVHGLSLIPDTTPNLYSLLNPGADSSGIIDLRDRDAVIRTVDKANPEIVLHLAAQALVRRSYNDPIDAFSSNTLGTAHLLDALRNAPRLKAIIVVTSDKAYENDERVRPYKESDAPGGTDPYSASKGCQEIISHCFRRSYFDALGIRLGTARAGNVVGGGDWSEERLMSDIIHAISCGENIVLRYPLATRPWQHVLEPLAGYLLYAQALFEGNDVPEALNFGPETSAPVEKVVNIVLKAWETNVTWVLDKRSHPKEALALQLDVSLASRSLGWNPHLDLETTIKWIVEWHKGHLAGLNPTSLTLKQIQSYQDLYS